jgi:hypothetical protein
MNPNREHKVDRLFREGIGAGDVPPPPDVWRNVAAEIANEPKRKRGAWWMFVAGATAASLFAALGFGLGQWGNPNGAGQTHSEWAHLPSKVEMLPVDSCQELPNTPLESNPNLLVQKGSAFQFADQNPQTGDRKIRNERKEKVVSYRPEGDLSVAQPVIHTPAPEQPVVPTPKPRNLREIIEFPISPSQNNGPVYAQQPKSQSRQTPTPQPDLFSPLNTPKESKWAVAGNFSPDFLVGGAILRGVNEAGFASLGSNPSDQTQNLSSESVSNDRKRVSTAYSAGLRVGMEVAPKVMLQTGINYASRSGEVPLTLVNDNGEFDYNSPGTSVYTAQLLEVPALVRYNWMDGKKVDLFLSSGPSVEWILKSSEFIEYQNQQISQPTPASSIAPAQVNWVVGTGVEILPIPRVGIQLEPMVRFGMLKSEIPGQSGRTIGTSLNTGLNFHF